MKRNIRLWLTYAAGIAASIPLAFFLLFVYLHVMELINPEFLYTTRKMAPFMPFIFITVTLASAVSLTLSLNFFRHLDHLVSAFKSVSGGDFAVRLDESKGPSEIRTMNHSFNRMVEELSQTETLRSDFVANVSHEFKTPLASIEGYASLLMTPGLTKEEEADYVKRILESTHQLSSLTGNILKLSKLDAGSIGEEQTRFSLDEQLRECFLALEPQWSAKDILPEIDLPEVTIRGYKNLLSLVWTNLYSNAVKFSPQGGTIRTELAADASSVRVSVSDDGPGMTEAEIRHIFDRFYQADTAHKAEGNGLGLALVAKVLKLSGGSAEIKSTPGKGSTFLITLPLGYGKE